MPVSKTFVSYSRSDEAFALKLAEDLKQHNINIWIDQLDIHPGHKWDTEIENALQNSDAMLLIMSAKSVVSDNVKDELSYALEENKKLIPIKINSCSIPFRIRRIQHIDFTDNYGTSLERLLKVLKPDHKIKPVASTGFLKVEEVRKIVSEYINANEEIKGELLIFKTTTQHTWLISTNKQLFCLLDDEDGRLKNNLVMWHMLLKDAKNKVFARQHKKYSGLLDIGERKNWLYSIKLFPDPSILVGQVKKLISNA